MTLGELASMMGIAAKPEPKDYFVCVAGETSYSDIILANSMQEAATLYVEESEYEYGEYPVGMENEVIHVLVSESEDMKDAVEFIVAGGVTINYYATELRK